MTEECAYRCGYFASGKDIAEHERYEHADCPRCGAKAPAEDNDGFAYSVTHRADCPRLKPGHSYADEMCPGGCGCLLGTDDPDRNECGCDGPCTAECRENGYPDAPAFKDIPRDDS